MRSFDVAIIGSGPGGMAAAINAASEGLSTVMIEATTELGGQARKSTKIENYPGFPDGVSGSDLTRYCVAQMKKFGAEVIAPVSVTKIECTEGKKKLLTLETEEVIEADSIIIAVGLAYRLHQASCLTYFIGHGAYYGCPSSEYLIMGKRNLIIIGGANSAGQAAMYLATKNPNAHVSILVRGSSIESTMSQYLVERIKHQPNISLLTETEMVSVNGETAIESITVDGKNGKENMKADAVYIFIGALPRTQFITNIEKDHKGFILTGRNVKNWNLKRLPFALETSLPGVFAIGDVRSESRKRVGAAIGEGSSVIADVYTYLSLKE